MKSFITKTLIFACVMFMNVNFALADVPNEVTLYEHINYNGHSETFISDDADLRDNPIGNDIVSSIDVQGGCVATLYEHINFEGKSETFTSEDLDLRDNNIGNDKVSSVKVICPINDIVGPDVFHQEDFVIGTFWDPPLTYDYDRNQSVDLLRFEYARDAHFNLLTAYSAGLQQEAFTTAEMDYRLDLAAQVGINSFVGDERFRSRTSTCLRYSVHCPPFDSDIAREVTDHYRSLKSSSRDAIYGYNIQDEPCGANLRQYDTSPTTGVDLCNDFVDPVKSWVQHIKTQDPTKLAFINMHPIYQNDREKWIAYLDTYLSDELPTRVPDVVSYDQYPFKCEPGTDVLKTDSDYFSTYFFALETIREKAGGRPLWVHPYATESPSGSDLCEPDSSQLQFMTFAPVAYGVKGLVYFTYGRPPTYGSALIDDNGLPTAKYYIVQSINRYLAEFVGPIIMRSTYLGTVHKTIYPLDPKDSRDKGLGPKMLIADSSTMVADLSHDDLMVGMFHDNESETVLYGIVVNKSLEEDKNITITLRGDHSKQLSLSIGHEEYSGGDAFKPELSTVYDSMTDSTTFIIPHLAGGEGRVFKTTISSPIGPIAWCSYSDNKYYNPDAAYNTIDSKLLSDSPNFLLAELDPALAPGSYRVVGGSYDGYDGRSEANYKQTKEVWIAEFRSATDTVLATSQSSQDLRDDTKEANWEGSMGHITLDEPATRIEVRHGDPSTSSSNSVHVACLGVTLEPEPTLKSVFERLGFSDVTEIKDEIFQGNRALTAPHGLSVNVILLAKYTELQDRINVFTYTPSSSGQHLFDGSAGNFGLTNSHTDQSFAAPEDFGIGIELPGPDGQPLRLFTESDKNPNQKQQAKVFQAFGGYIIAFEDTVEDGDEDFQDLILFVQYAVGG